MGERARREFVERRARNAPDRRAQGRRRDDVQRGSSSYHPTPTREARNHWAHGHSAAPVRPRTDVRGPWWAEYTGDSEQFDAPPLDAWSYYMARAERADEQRATLANEPAPVRRRVALRTSDERPASVPKAREALAPTLRLSTQDMPSVLPRRAPEYDVPAAPRRAPEYDVPGPTRRALEYEDPAKAQRAHVAPTPSRGFAAYEAPAANKVVSLQDARERRSQDTAYDYPQYFITPGLRMLVTHNLAAATEYYRERARSAPHKAEGWLGLMATALTAGKLSEAAPLLVKGYGLDPKFPIGRLVRDAQQDDPNVWYELASQLVALKNKTAYECADLVLFECMRCGEASEDLRQRAIRVRQDIWEALEKRVTREQRRHTPTTAPRRTEPSLKPKRILLHSAAVFLAVVFVGAIVMSLSHQSSAAVPSPPPAMVTSDASVAEATAVAPAAPVPAAAASPAGKCTLIIDANQGSGFAVSVNGQPEGLTPIGLEVPVGATYLVEVDGGKRFSSWKTVIKPMVAKDEINLRAELR